MSCQAKRLLPRIARPDPLRAANAAAEGSIPGGTQRLAGSPFFALTMTPTPLARLLASREVRHAPLGPEAPGYRPWARLRGWGLLKLLESRASCWHCRNLRIANASDHKTVWVAGWQSRWEDDAGKDLEP